MRRYLTLALVLGLLSGAMSTANAYEKKDWSRWQKTECRMGPYGSDSHVRDLIRCAHNRVGEHGLIPMALYIAERESGYEPHAENPYSTAAGLFQWLESSWPGTRFPKMAHRYSYPSFNRMNARASAFVSARVMKQGGCDPWFETC